MNLNHNDPHGWYVLATKPIHKIEFAVGLALHQREYAAMVPFEEKSIKRRGRRNLEKKKFPLFTRYVFVQLPRNRVREEFHALKLVEGVQGLISASRLEFRPLALNLEQIAFVKALSEGGWSGGATKTTLHKAFQPGTNVKIIDGPFAGFAAKVDSVTRKQINVMLEMFGRMNIVGHEPQQLAVA